MLQVQHLSKTYGGRGFVPITALRDMNFEVQEGEFVAIMGESGSGKTTLLNILAGLMQPTTGEVALNGASLRSMKPDQMAKFRREKLGFIFQDFHLLERFTVKDNIVLPLVLSEKKKEEMEQRLTPLAKRLGLTEHMNRYPHELSGGQQQRAAVARALITKPELLLADEPTGQLDSHTADDLMQIFQDVNVDGQTILMVTHSIRSASYARRVLFIRDGMLFHEIYRMESPYRFAERIADVLPLLRENPEASTPSDAEDGEVPHVF
ncbi:MAG: ABC transporter ATP-binding protein [Peptoniphilaceae bacterium]|nr:ABC transporter ATP-binding protein [Peptoniphilaceae bacterium]MDY6086279.1 ABC transporter ATP-binding protein [Peptoniphilaceae bacterium]